MFTSNTTYTYPLLESKLAIPPVSGKLVNRTRLFESLAESMDKRLTIVVSPAGYGKSSLVSSWCQRLQSPEQRGATEESNGRVAVGWLSLDELDNDPVRFWHYFVSAWCRALNNSDHAAPLELEQEVSRLIRTYSPVPVDAILTLLLNELAKAVSFSREFVLVLDDYHLIAETQLHKGLGLFVERLPERVHLVLATRSDPDLPLSRYRTRGWLVELRAEDLLFSQAETGTFFEQSMPLTLSEKEVAQLTGRTEGWVAGLQLAGLALQSQKKAGKDTGRFISDFAGSHHFVLDYLSDEVLENQPDEIRNFLLRTSLLEKFSRSLCEAVTENANTRNLLNRLEEANLFIIPLDEKRQWYRYHHLFAEVLQAHLLETLPDEVPGLHRKAARWFAAQEMSDEAVAHALASQDFDLAAQVMQRHAELVWLRREFVTLHNWFGALPESLLQNYPELGILKAHFLIIMGDVPGAERAVQYAQSGLLHQAGTGLKPQSDEVQSPETEYYPRLEAELATLQGVFQMLRGNFKRAKELSEYATNRLSASRPADLFLPLNLGAAYWMSGDIPRAVQILEKARQDYLNSNNLYFARVAISYLDVIKLLENRLSEAESECREAFKLGIPYPALATGLTPQLDHNSLYVRLGIILYHQGRLAEGEANLKLGVELARAEKNNLVLEAGLLWLARLYLSKQNSETETGFIRQLVAEAETILSVSNLNWLWIIPSVPAFLSELYLKLGDRDKARARLARFRTKNNPDETDTSHQLPDETELSAVVEAENLAYGWLLLEDGQVQPLLELTPNLKVVATQTGRKRSLLELLVMEAIALNQAGQTEEAINRLQAALELAAPERVAYIFIERANQLEELLAETLGRPSAKMLGLEFRQLLVGGKAKLLSEVGAEAGKSTTSKVKMELVEPLSERELEVLELIAQGVSNPEIAERLIIAIPTVKKHISNIFAKLEVTNRVQAILRAKELGLIS